MFPRTTNLFVVCIVLVVIAGIQQVTAVEAGTWTRKADIPTARSGLGAAVVDRKIYVLGGWQGPFGQTVHTAVVEEYDPATDTWTRRADMLAARGAHSVAAVDGMIYAIGGWYTWGREVSTVEAYDPATDTWTTKADMPTARAFSAIAVVDGRIYVIGGGVSTAAPGVTSVVEAYDPATDTWTTKAGMPTARFKFAACVVDGRIYAFGGNIEWGWVSPDVPTVEVYDPATDTWNQTSDMPMARWGHSASIVAGKIYIVGGVSSAIIELFEAGKLEWDKLLELFSTVDVYDPATDTWTTAADLPTTRTRHAAAVVDGKIYAIGGDFGAQNEIVSTSTVEEFDPGLLHASSSVSPAGKLLDTWGHVKKVQ